MKKIVGTISTIIAGLLILVYGLFANMSFQTDNSYDTKASAKSVNNLDANSILLLVNNQRISAGLKPLVSDPRLVSSAQVRTDDMVKRNYFSHYDPITGSSLVLILATNPECSAASENIAEYVYPTIDPNKSIYDSWMNSKPHHDAILNKDYSLTGIAISGNKIVEDFCVAETI